MKRLIVMCLVAGMTMHPSLSFAQVKNAGKAGESVQQFKSRNIQGRFTRKATLAILDKRTSERDVVTLNVGASHTHEDIIITVSKCWTEISDVLPEHAAFIEVIQPTMLRSGKVLFNGWLFANKSEISNLQHIKYDVIMLSCSQ